MPNWKKVIVSGSAASLSSLSVTNNVTAQSFTGSLFGTSSFAVSASYAPTSISASNSLTASYVNPLRQTVIVSGSIDFSPTTDPDPTGAILTDTFLFVSSSNTSLGKDLYFRQDGNLAKWKWIESQLGSGLLYGGVLTSSGSNLYVSSGSGIIVTYGASSGSEVNPILNYVKWNHITASANYLTSSTQTYVYIDSSGNLQQQTTWFTADQYQASIPLGVYGHADRTAIRGTGGEANTMYATHDQTFSFIRAFGPLKLSGLTLTPQSGSLQLSISAGTAYNLGGFYQLQYNDPSHYNISTFATSSFARWYRSGSGFISDTNGGTFYTTIDPTKYDDGSGVLQNVGGGSYSIQRVFINPTAARSAVYYGQKTYSTLAEAIANVSTDPFTEAELTAHSNIFAGYLILKGNTSDLSNNENYIVQSGLFRNTVGGGGSTTVTTALNDLSDVNITSPTNGQALVYSSGTWINGNPTSASYATNSTSASNALSALSASNALTASSADTFIVRNGLTGSNALFTGTITAQALYVQTVTSSVEYITGSTRFGSVASNTHQFTGSVSVSGSLQVQGNNVITSNQTSSMSVLSSSFAVSSSYSVSGSFAVSASSAIIANSAITATSASYATTSSFSLQALSASFAAFVTSASYASTASYALNAGGTGISAIYIADEGTLQGTASYFDFTGAGVTATVSNGTASISITGGGGGGGTSGLTQTFTQSAAATTWSFAHSINSRTPIVETYDNNYDVIIPSRIYSPSAFQTNIYFDVASSGYAIISTGGVLAVTGSNSILDQQVPATTWSFNHNLGTQYPVFTIFDSSDNVIIPLQIQANTTASATIYFSTARTGKAVASIGGAPNPSASYAIFAVNATSASYAATASSADNFIVRNNLTASNVLVTGTVTAQTLYIQTVTSSVVYSSGSNTFGNLLSNTQQFTGSVTITGSLKVNDNYAITSNQTSSMSVLSSSFAASSSYSVSGSYSVSSSFASSALTSSYALSASYAANVPETASYALSALTASYALNAGAGAGFPYSGSAVITGSLYVSGGLMTGTASYALYALTAANAPGYTVQFTQSVAAATWSFVHNMNTRNPIVQVYDTNYNQLLPNAIQGVDVNTVEVRFDYLQAGYAILSNGGGLYVTGSTSQLNQTSTATTWSFTHNLNSKYVGFEVYDTNDNIIIPAGVHVINTNSAEIYFATPTAGTAIAQFSGINGAPNATTASYAVSSSYAVSASYVASASFTVSSSYAVTASILAPVTSGYVVLTQVSQSLNFVDDTAAAAGGVPLGGLYRNGNFIAIRIS